MSLLSATLILAAIMVTGISIVAYFAYKTVQVQQKMILTIAMFKKASDPFHLNVMTNALNATKEQDPVKVDEDPNDQPSIPRDLSDAALSEFRKNM